MISHGLPKMTSLAQPGTPNRAVTDDDSLTRDALMYLPAWQGLGLREMWADSGKEGLPFPLNAPNTTYFHTARSAIYHIVRELVNSGRHVVLMPDYHMGNEVRAVLYAGAQIVWYPVTREFGIDMAVLRRLCREGGAQVLFVIHYAGWPHPMDQLNALCAEHGLLLVEDCALALLSGVDARSVGTYGDYAIFCLYKTLPLPDGGVLVQKRHVFDDLTRLPLQRSGRMFVAGRIAELGLERFRIRYPRVGRRLFDVKQGIGRFLNALRVERIPVGDTGFNPSHVNVGMSSWSRRVLTGLDYESIRRRRRENFIALREQLPAQAAVRTDLPPGVCPLFFPLLVADKSGASRALRQRGVMATELWNEGDPSVAGHEGEDARFLRRHVLELPIHQDITNPHIEYMARQVGKLNVLLPSSSTIRAEYQTA
ncbi:MAG: DegT/DnrJ/EryC1/StrS family aminotransferase [Nitrospirae bacterium]|nr:DegT/DnrJ/EryC1/StrS family aminotransferase [Nitrospirota bacterium]